MIRYRRKPTVVEAFQLTDDPEMEAPAWFTQAVLDEKIWIDRCLRDGHTRVYGCTIRAPEGKLHAHLGDYIVRDTDGKLYPCRAVVFARTYEKVRG